MNQCQEWYPRFCSLNHLIAIQLPKDKSFPIPHSFLAQPNVRVASVKSLLNKGLGSGNYMNADDKDHRIFYFISFHFIYQESLYQRGGRSYNPELKSCMLY